MAPPSARMRLTVEILPLQAENSHGPYQAAAVAAFKGRKFALPVQLEDTFEQVWNQLEERYKRNYLTPPQAASFTIKKLQDAYDCDLDLGDTVSSIYEGENDPLKRLIKVVPSFVNRDFSVPVTSNLRPAIAHKRHRESHEDRASKRRRLEEYQDNLSDKDHARDRPLPSTESDHSGNDGGGIIDPHTAQTNARASRSQSGASVVIVDNAQTGYEEFTAGVKEESPELGMPTVRGIPNSDKEPSRSPGHAFKKPFLPASASKKVAYDRQRDTSLKESPHQPLVQADNRVSSAEPQDEDGDQSMEDVTMDDHVAQFSVEPTLSPVSSTEPILEVPEPVQTGATVPRKSVYDTPGSPDFVRGSVKRLKTYGRFPRTPRLIQKQVEVLNNSRSRSKSSQTSGTGSSKSQYGINGRARAFQKPKQDEIVSTPQERLSSPSQRAGSSVLEDDGLAIQRSVTDTVVVGDRNEEKTPRHGTKPGKVSSLKKPARLSYTMPVVPSNKVGVNLFVNKRYNSNNLGEFVPTQVRDRSQSKAARGRGNSEAKSNTTRASASTSSIIKGLSPVANARLGNMKQRLAKTDSQQTSQEAPERKISPKVVISKSTPISTEPRISYSPSVQRSTLHQPWSASSKKDMAGVASDLLNASRISAPAKEVPVPSVDLDKGHLTRDTSEPSASRTAPVRSEVPLPDNIEPLAPNNTRAVTGGSTTPKEPKTFKTPAQKAQKVISSVKPTKKDVIRGVSESVVRTNTPRKTEVPLDVKHLPSRRLSDSSCSKRTVTKSEVPLPENVRHLYKEPSPPLAVLTPGPNPEEPIVLSSGVSSTSSDDSEEEGVQESALTDKIGVQASVAQPEMETMDLEESNAVTSGDAESLPDEDETKTFSEDEQAFSEKDPAPDTAASSEPPRSPRPTVETTSNLGTKENSTSQPAPWNADSWRFGTDQQHTAVTQKPDEEMLSKSSPGPRSRLRSGSTNTTKSESRSVAPSNSRSVAPSNSRSVSGVDSSRSSPAVARRPARFLSHSPTPNNSSSEEESVARSPSPVKPAPKNAMSDKADEDNSDSSSSDSSSSSDESDQNLDPENEDEDKIGDIEMADTNGDVKAGTAPLSSLPVPQQSRLQMRSPPATSQLTQPPTSQSLPRISQVPFPSTKVDVPATNPITSNRSSQPQTPAAGTRRPTYQKFPSIRQQLSAARSTPASSQISKKFDARTLKLSKLTKAKQQGKKGAVFNGNESSSSDESSSDDSSSSSDEDKGKGKNAGFCSVA
ncbi:hypothetical protein K505DRAFT_374268 [Melanomma pulvis-pyrius CBS 109.77]|uniref:Nucleolar protein Dnt1-like N-terminal domain-containing protein n=1 Tax=Melanomma pulvis-pyrius CBS 109.77 TaxID=1314802 RepID=A0A6A6XFY8_9PLEO|nr:hypothetical protein K505DRAFT_374268 [Melanomma pulvis-pyrius CBS 109.77]